MHVDYVREVYYKLKNQKLCEPFADLEILKRLATDELVDLAHKQGNEKVRSICETMMKSKGYRLAGEGHKKITDKQQFAIAFFLLETFGTAKRVIAEAFNINEEDVDLKEDEK